LHFSRSSEKDVTSYAKQEPSAMTSFTVNGLKKMGFRGEGEGGKGGKDKVRLIE
jgi:hypothetical protein